MSKPGIESEWLDRAVHQASLSSCQKSKRGAIVILDGEVISEAHNRLPGNEQCTSSEQCRAECGRRCLHAESRAIHAAWRQGYRDLRRAVLVHIKVMPSSSRIYGNYSAVWSGPPSCTQCAREVYEYTGGIWLLHEDGWRFYEAREFYEETWARERE